VALLSRRGERADDDGVRELREWLGEHAVRLDVLACDVGDRGALRDVVDRLPESGPPLRGVVHAAGVLNDGVLTGLTRDAFADVLRSKVVGGWNLHEVTRERDLALFVAFSSIVGIWGNGGQGAYAAGNAFLDGLMAYRRARGLAGTSVAWGPWGDGGLADQDKITRHFERDGITPLEPDAGMAALDRIVDQDAALSVVADVDWSRLAPALDTVGMARLFQEIPQARAALDATADATARTASPATLAERVAGLPDAEQRRIVAEFVSDHVASVLGYRGSRAIDMSRPYKELGFDSLTSVEFRNALVAATGVAVGGTVVYDYPTPAATVDHLLDLVRVGERGPDAGHVAAVVAASDEPIAIIGMACRLPGGVSSPDELWSLVDSGGEGIGPFPTDRGWDPGLSGFGGFLDDVGAFDAAFFGISPREALAMNPQQRLALECSWEALERAGIDPTGLRGSDGGVFLGLAQQDYGPRLHEPSDSSEGYLLTGSAQSVVSGRISYALGLEGPSVSVDTACSSSLVALHLAVAALRRGECSLALAGGVAVMSTPGSFMEFARQGGLSADGRCKAFSDAADGTGWAEGAAVVALERLSDAQRRGRTILALVRGSAINSDGASNGLTAPNGPSQQRVILRALADAGMGPAEVDAVEAHGTGTRLGDPIEAAALLATYGRGRPADRPLLLGTVKSNIGHTQAAAGVTGVIKMVEALRHGTLPRTLHVDTPSSHVDWSAGAVELLTEPRAWPDVDRPWRAGVSAFGISGTNAHVILERAPDEPSKRPATADYADSVAVPWVFSAATDAALRARAGGLAGHGGDDSALDVAWTLAASRAGLARRAVVFGRDREALAEGVRAVAHGREAPGVIIGDDPATTGAIAAMFSGQGSQRVGMGAGLSARYPVFANALDEICAGFDLGMPLRDRRT